MWSHVLRGVTVARHVRPSPSPTHFFRRPRVHPTFPTPEPGRRGIWCKVRVSSITEVACAGRECWRPTNVPESVPNCHGRPNHGITVCICLVWPCNMHLSLQSFHHRLLCVRRQTCYWCACCGLSTLLESRSLFASTRLYRSIWHGTSTKSTRTVATRGHTVIRTKLTAMNARKKNKRGIVKEKRKYIDGHRGISKTFYE